MVSSVVTQHPVSGRKVWSWAILCVLAYWAAVLWLFRETVMSLEAIWSRSDTFAHGYLILPIAIWLVYRQRSSLGKLNPRPWLPGLILVLPVAVVWLFGYLVDVTVLMQFSLVALLVVGTWAILGTTIAREIAFPLGFLFLAVPVGIGLIPPLQEFTAFATVRMVELSGVPVFRDGLHFSLPSGNWRVVEACSGVRYLIASVTLGLLYAHLNYRRWSRRVTFVLISFLLPIGANALRAYFIVMLGHLSNGKIAAGVDHLIYGWLFFGLVMLLLFWIGSFWAEDTDTPPVVDGLPQSAGTGSRVGMLCACVLGILLASSPLLATRSLSAAVEGAAPVSSLLPAGHGESTAAEWPWVPGDRGALETARATYGTGESSVYLAIYHYGSALRNDAEAVAPYREFRAPPKEWRVVDAGSRLLPWGERELTLNEVVIDNGQTRLRVWYWFRLGGYNTGNLYEAKARELWLRIGRNPQGAQRMVLTAVDQPDRTAEPVLEAFLISNWQALEGRRQGE